jgi:hypothetical protein
MMARKLPVLVLLLQTSFAQHQPPPVQNGLINQQRHGALHEKRLPNLRLLPGLRHAGAAERGRQACHSMLAELPD